MLIPILSAILLSSCPGGSCDPPRYVRVADLPGRTDDPEPGYLPGTPMPTPPAVRQWVWLRRQGVWGFGWQRPDGLWVVDPGSKRKPASGAPASSRGLSSRPAPSAETTQAAPPDHRGAFLGWLNGWRAQHGLAPCGYSEDLEWAALANCRAQAARGASGHYTPNGGWFQVSFLGPTCLEQAIQGWVASPSHNEALLRPEVTMVGIAVEGVSWSCNLR